MKNKNKAFTLVELLVVIAILAILATVALVGYNSFIEKANYSNDQVMITQMNHTLLADDVLNDYEYAGDAINALYMNGWNSGKLKPFSRNYYYAYSLEKNKMYLVDKNGTVLYPEETVSPSELWGFYSNAVEEKIDGVHKYIAMDNIINGSNLTSLIGSDETTIDLNGFFFGIDSTYENLVLKNGIIVKGNVSSDSEEIVHYEEQVMNDTVIAATYENKVFSNINTSTTGKSAKLNTTYKDSVFYNSSIFTDITYTEDCIITFENCTFIGASGGSLAAIELYDNSTHDITVNIKNCTFFNTERGINTTANNSTGTNTVIIENCTFNGTTQAKYAALQIVKKCWNIEFKGNTINSLGAAVTAIRFHESYDGFDDLNNLDNITFTNNKINKDILESKYIDLDDKFTPADFYEAVLAKFEATLSLK